MTPQSIGGFVYPNFEMLVTKIAFALKRIISNQHFNKENYCGRAKKLKHKTDFFEEDRLLTLPSYWRS